jgi:HK97 gp10 family phage protein
MATKRNAYASSGQIKIHGLAEARKALLSLPAEIVSKNGGPVKQALSAACEPIRELAEALAPKDTGRLEISVYKFRDRNPRAKGNTERYVIGIRRGKRGKIKKQKEQVEGIFGIGLIKEKRTRAAPELKANEAPYGRYVEFGTSKMQAQPFMRPAFNLNKGLALVTFRDVLSSRLLKIAKKLNKKRGLKRGR